MTDLDNKNSENEAFITMKRWMENRNAGKSFVDYFLECGYREIAIYGIGDLGKLLYEEICDSNVKVVYFADRNAEGVREMDDIPVVTVMDIPNMPEVDVIVITPVGNYKAISETLAKAAPKVRTLSLRDAVYEF